MIRQLIFTSAPMGLEPGRSGYCTVTRDRSLSQRLVREIERISVLDFSVADGLTPKVAAFRFLHVGSTEVYLLSRIRSSGQDYTKRTNYIGHHLVIDPREIDELPTPAQILVHWDGWRDEWSENPRYLDESASPDLASCDLESSNRSITWFQWAGDEKSAEIPKSGKSIFRTNPGDEERLLLLFAESAAKFDSPEQAWQVPFTNFLQTNEDAADFTWIGGWPNTQVDGIEIAKGTNFFDLEPYDDEMAALTLPPEEEPVDDSPLIEEVVIAEPPLESPDARDESEIADEAEVPEEPLPPSGPLPEEAPEPVPQEPPPIEPVRAPQEEKIQPEVVSFPEPEAEPQPESAPELEPAASHQAGQKAAYHAETDHSEDRDEETVSRTPAGSQPSPFVGKSVKRKRRRIPKRVLLSLAACMTFLLCGILLSLFDHLDDLETRNDKPLNHLAGVCHRDVSGIGFGHER